MAQDSIKLINKESEVHAMHQRRKDHKKSKGYQRPIEGQNLKGLRKRGNVLNVGTIMTEIINAQQKEKLVRNVANAIILLLYVVLRSQHMQLKRPL